MRVDKLRSTFEFDIAHRHFPLHPDTPEDGLTLDELFAGRNIDIPASQARMSRLMAAEGLPYGTRTMTYNSRLAQELGKWADARPEGEEIHNALFQAYFVDNLNLAMSKNLIKIAERVGHGITTFYCAGGSIDLVALDVGGLGHEVTRDRATGAHGGAVGV